MQGCVAAHQACWGRHSHHTHTHAHIHHSSQTRSVLPVLNKDTETVSKLSCQPDTRRHTHEDNDHRQPVVTNNMRNTSLMHACTALQWWVGVDTTVRGVRAEWKCLSNAMCRQSLLSVHFLAETIQNTGRIKEQTLSHRNTHVHLCMRAEHSTQRIVCCAFCPNEGSGSSTTTTIAPTSIITCASRLCVHRRQVSNNLAAVCQAASCSSGMGTRGSCGSCSAQNASRV